MCVMQASMQTFPAVSLSVRLLQAPHMLPSVLRRWQSPSLYTRSAHLLTVSWAHHVAVTGPHDHDTSAPGDVISDSATNRQHALLPGAQRLRQSSQDTQLHAHQSRSQSVLSSSLHLAAAAVITAGVATLSAASPSWASAEISTHHPPGQTHSSALPSSIAGFSTSAAPAAPSTSAGPAASQPTAQKTPRRCTEGHAFRAYTGDGQVVPWSSVLQQVAKHDVVLLGEYHDDAVAHVLELAVWQSALRLAQSVPTCSTGATAAGAGSPRGPNTNPTTAQPTRRAVLSLEMFETDTQGVMNEYLAGSIRDRDLVTDARAWPNYRQDYHPMVELAKQQGTQVVCANAPRRFVSLVGRQGPGTLDGLPDASKTHLPPLPVPPPSRQYMQKIDALMTAAKPTAPEPQPMTPPPATPGSAASAARVDTQLSSAVAVQPQPATPAPPAPSPVPQAAAIPEATTAEEKTCPYIGLSMSSNFYAAQNLWDASMAYSISRALTSHTGAGNTSPLVVHVCGKAHCEGRLGIVEHLQRYAPAAKILVVVFIPARSVNLSQQDFQDEALLNQADFVVLTDGTKSYLSTHPV